MRVKRQGGTRSEESPPRLGCWRRQPTETKSALLGKLQRKGDMCRFGVPGEACKRRHLPCPSSREWTDGPRLSCRIEMIETNRVAVLHAGPG